MSVTYSRARQAIAARLSVPALEHSERVAAGAVSLAALYGVDEADAALAGLLHDWDRETAPGDLVARARELGLDVTDVDEAVPYLLHGPVAAAGLAAEFPDLPDTVIEAVGAHTYGVPGMSELAMVVYIADVIEPSRQHEGVAALRESVGTRPLDELYAEAYSASLHHLIDTRRRIHPQTVATWNAIVSDTRR